MSRILEHFFGIIEGFVLGNFKHPNYKLKIRGANMPLSKTILLMSARLL